MARIRTIKPELWTDPEFTECSLSARLLFIASLNFASDYGVLPDKPRQLKMQCLPADNCNVEELIEELIEHEFLIRTCAPNGDKVLVIRTFSKHQKINRRTAGRWGDPMEWGSLTEDSVRTHGAPPPGMEGKGRDSSEEDLLEDAVPTHPKSERDEMWDALTAAIGKAKTKTERSNRGRTVTELLEAGATPEQIGPRCDEYRRRYANAALTDSALRKHWSDLTPRDGRPKSIPYNGGMLDPRALA